MTYDILQMTNLCLSTDTRNKTTAKKDIKTFTHVNIICSLHIKFCLTQPSILSAHKLMNLNSMLAHYNVI